MKDVKGEEKADCLRKALRDGFLKKALMQLQRFPSGQFEASV